MSRQQQDDRVARSPQTPLRAALGEVIRLYEAGEFDAVSSRLPELLERFPRAVALWSIQGAVHKARGDDVSAVRAFRMVTALAPTHADGHNNLGVVQLELGRTSEAVTSGRKSLLLTPDSGQASYNLANGLRAEGRLEAAVRVYLRAITLAPELARAHNNLAATYEQQGNSAAAIDSYHQAIALNPGHAEAHNNLGNVLMDRGKLLEAIESFDRAIELWPDYPYAQAQSFFLKRNICDWRVIADFQTVSDRLGVSRGAIPPFSTLSMEDDPARQMRRSRVWAREQYPHTTPPRAAPPAIRPRRLRLGYFSADFHTHATLFLMLGLLRMQDRTRFEVIAYSYGKSRGGRLRERLLAHVDGFHDVRGMADSAIVERARADGLDIAIDLKGYTQSTRSELFAHRLAPVQISYLGYPGTMAADFIDYIIADHTVLPSEHRANYTESVIYLPDCYQANDDQREISEERSTRADHGLPENGIVFCCFNRTYKISPSEFDIWMRLLDRIEGSVVWLLRSNEPAETNLRREAEARGIDSDRLIFAKAVPNPEHLARHRHADLFLDTFNYNAHTTASDALWAGLPVVTKRGEQFAARVAASLLNAIGLPELITTTEEAYEALIVELATDRARLADLRERLSDACRTQPLFDTDRYARHFEAGLDMAYQRYLEGLEPADIDVPVRGSTAASGSAIVGT